MSWLMQVRRNSFIACEPHEDRTMTILLAAVLTLPNTVPGMELLLTKHQFNQVCLIQLC